MAPAELIRKTDDGQVKSKQTSTCHLHTDPGEHGRSNPKTVCVCVPLASTTSLCAKKPCGLSCVISRNVVFCLAHLFLPRFLPPYVYVSFKPTLFFFPPGTLPTGAADETRPPSSYYSYQLGNRSNKNLRKTLKEKQA